MRLFEDMADDRSIPSNVTSKQDDVSRYKYLTSTRYHRESVHTELLALGIDISKFESPKSCRTMNKNDVTMSDINKKLSALEKRTTSLKIVYDNLLERASELESRAHLCETEFQKEKKSFDIVEFLMKQDGRSKSMFDHVALFFYVLISKLKRKGINISSTTELWTRLGEEEVKTAFENTVINLGFSKNETYALNVILDIIHETDIEIIVNKALVDTHNLTSKLNHLSCEFTVENPETDEDDLPNITQETESRQFVESNYQASALDHPELLDTSQDTGNDSGTNVHTSHGDNYDMDCLLLYLQIQTELDPVVRSALRRAVAVAHCSMVKKSHSFDETSLLEAASTDNEEEEIVIPTCINEIQLHSTPARSEQSYAIFRPRANLNSKFLDDIESDDDFLDLATSTPKPLRTSPSLTQNLSNNASIVEELFTPAKIDLIESMESMANQTKQTRPMLLDLPRSKRISIQHQNNKRATDDVEEQLLISTCNGHNTLSRLESFLTSQRSLTPEEGQERVENFRSFYKHRLRKKTAEIVKAERDSIKSLISPPKSLKPKVNFDACVETRSPLTKFVCEIYEADRLNEFDDFSDSECTSASSSLHSSFFFSSDAGSSLNAPDDDERSISLHEELSERGFFPCGSARGSQISNDISDSDNLIEHEDIVSKTGSESKKQKKEHVNFFSSPDSVNPYAFDFDADYYMLWPGQEMEIEMKDLSSEIHLYSDEDKTLDFETSNRSFTESLTSEKLTPANASKYDKWLLG